MALSVLGRETLLGPKRFIEEMEESIKERFLSRYQDWTDKDKEKVAREIAQGAIKYGMTSVDNNKKIVFNKDQWLQLDGESGPYIQYTHARICSLLKKNCSSVPSLGVIGPSSITLGKRLSLSNFLTLIMPWKMLAIITRRLFSPLTFTNWPKNLMAFMLNALS